MNLLAVALILAFRHSLRWANDYSLLRLDRQCRAIVWDWDQ